MSIKPETPRGTRDFLPAEAANRQFIFEVIRRVFVSYGYLPVETPAQELLKTLMGKYGEEGDRLIFKILNSGDFLRNVNPELLTKGDSRKLLPAISDKALRYDLTVPFARFVVQHRSELFFPFKRYQIQPVWRADRPQKGRYREFFQCDVDVIGSKSCLNEIEMIQIMADVFHSLGVKVKIRINDRRLLQRLAGITGMGGDAAIQFSMILDKKEKAGTEAVKKMLRHEGCSDEDIERLMHLLEGGGDFHHLHEKMAAFVGDDIGAVCALKNLRVIFESCGDLGIDNLIFDNALARGLDYYTGAIFEVTAEGFPVSVCGGGRYDNLTGIFGLDDMSGVGVSFGADRIYDVMEKNNLFHDTGAFVQILFLNFGTEECKTAQRIAMTLRKRGYRASVYPDKAKVKKQMKYGDQIRADLVAIIGADELTAGTVTVKDMRSGKQRTLKQNDLAEFCDERF